jgi:protein-S-isoprenylcysteine O-methyltransferase Ste14
MAYDAQFWIKSIWATIGVVWLVTALRLKPVARTQHIASRILHVLLLVPAAYLLFSTGASAPWLDARVLAGSAFTVAAGISLTMMGAAIAIAARLYLGANWSGRPTIKEGHELIRGGPYALVRHPIYTGLLVAALGTAVAFGQVRDLVAVPLVLIAFWLKLRAEERLLLQAFPDEYPAYQRTVKSAIIPFIL